MPRMARSRSADGPTIAALLPPSSSRERPKRAGDARPDLAAHPRRAGGAEQRHAGVVDERLPDGGVAQDHLRDVGGAARLRQRPRQQGGRRRARSAGPAPTASRPRCRRRPARCAVFHDHTATGKLNAEITPTTPSGCQVSISRWPGRSEAMVRPYSWRERPTAKSQMSIISCTSPSASEVILPASRLTSVARSSGARGAARRAGGPARRGPVPAPAATRRTPPRPARRQPRPPWVRTRRATRPGARSPASGPRGRRRSRQVDAARGRRGGGQRSEVGLGGKAHTDEVRACGGPLVEPGEPAWATLCPDPVFACSGSLVEPGEPPCVTLCPDPAIACGGSLVEPGEPLGEPVSRPGDRGAGSRHARPWPASRLDHRRQQGGHDVVLREHHVGRGRPQGHEGVQGRHPRDPAGVAAVHQRRHDPLGHPARAPRLVDDQDPVEVRGHLEQVLLRQRGSLPAMRRRLSAHWEQPGISGRTSGPITPSPYETKPRSQGMPVGRNTSSVFL